MKSLGQIAYEAYATKVDWKSPFTGQTLKEWDRLKIINPIVAEAWECAALMVTAEPRVKVGSEQTQMSTIALIDTRLTMPGESLGTVVSTDETIRAGFKVNDVVKNSSTRRAAFGVGGNCEAESMTGAWERIMSVQGLTGSADFIRAWGRRGPYSQTSFPSNRYRSWVLG
jgi:hypothetical protein